MNINEVIKYPILTEKTYAQIPNNVYAFAVDLKTNRTEVKQAIEFIFQVKVAKVNIVNIGKKPAQLGKSKGFTNKIKKAIIIVKEGKINLYPEDVTKETTKSSKLKEEVKQSTIKQLEVKQPEISEAEKKATEKIAKALKKNDQIKPLVKDQAKVDVAISSQSTPSKPKPLAATKAQSPVNKVDQIKPLVKDQAKVDVAVSPQSPPVETKPLTPTKTQSPVNKADQDNKKGSD